MEKITQEMAPFLYQSIQSRITLELAKNKNFAKELSKNPKQAIEQLIGMKMDAQINVKIVEAEPLDYTFVVPKLDNSSKELNDSQLDAVAGGIVSGGCIIFPTDPIFGDKRGGHNPFGSEQDYQDILKIISGKNKL